MKLFIPLCMTVACTLQRTYSNSDINYEKDIRSRSQVHSLCQREAPHHSTLWYKASFLAWDALLIAVRVTHNSFIYFSKKRFRPDYTMALHWTEMKIRICWHMTSRVHTPSDFNLYHHLRETWSISKIKIWTLHEWETWLQKTRTSLHMICLSV